jgi:hypothetical protein
MKKWLIGCGVTVLVVCIVGAVAAYVFVWRPLQGYAASFKQLGEITEIEKNVSNKAAFTAPEGNELTEEMVTRFVKVQENLQARLGSRAKELKAKYDAMDKGKSGDAKPSITEAMGALKDLAGLIVEGKKAQVDALNESKFSLAEYNWVRTQVYMAAGITYKELNLRQMVENAQAGGESKDADVKPAANEDGVPEKNKELVKPYAEKLTEWAPFAFLGL